MAEVAAEAPVAADFAVTIGEEAVAVSNVALKAGTDKTYTLTVALNGKEGLVKVNGVEAAAASDYKAPTVVSVANVNGNQLVVTFSEAVVNANVDTNYMLKNTITGRQIVLNTSDEVTPVPTAAAPVIAVSADGKVATVTLTAAQTDYMGVKSTNSLDEVAYRLFIVNGNTISDKATPANAMPGNQYKNFDGKIEADTIGPAFVSAQLSTGTRELTVKFNENTNSVDVTKVSLSDGTTTFALGSGDSVTTGNGTTALTYKITNENSISKLALLSGTITVSLSAGAVKDASNNLNDQIASKPVTSVVNPTLLAEGTYYDELTSKLHLKFNKVMNIATLTDLSKITVDNSGQALTSANINGNMTLDNAANSDELVFSLAPLAKAEIQNATARNDANKGKYTVTVAKDAITDLSATDLGAAVTVALTYNRDDLKPTIADAKYSNKTGFLDITFSETTNKTLAQASVLVFTKDTTGAWAELGANKSLTDGIDNAFNADSWVADKAGANTARFLLSGNNKTDMETAAPNGVFIKIVATNGLTDANGNALDLDATVKPAAAAVKQVSFVDDVSAVASNPVVITTKKLSLAFNKALDKTAAETVANYYAFTAAAPANKIVPATATLQADQKTVILIFADALQSGVAYTFVQQNLVDAQGFAVTKQDALTFTATAQNPKLVSVVYNDVDGSGTKTAGDTIVATFDQPVQVAAGQTITADEFGLLGAAGAADTAWYNYGADAVAGGVDDKNGLGTNPTFVVSGNTLTVTIGSTPDPTIGVFTANTNAGTALLTDTNQDATIDNGETPVLAKIVGEDGATNITVDTPALAFVKAPDNKSPLVKSVVYTDVNKNAIVDADDTLVITFDKNIAYDDTKAIVATDFVGTTDGAAVDADWALGGATFAKTGDDTITVTLAADSNLNATAATKFLDKTVKVALKNGDITNAGLSNTWGIIANGGADAGVACAVAKAVTVAGDNGQAPNLVSVTKLANGNFEFKFSKEVAVDLSSASSVFVTGLNLTVDEGDLAGDGVANITYKTDGTTTDYTTVVVTKAGTDKVDQFTTVVVKIDGMTTVKDIVGRTGIRTTTTPMNVIIAE